MSRLNTLVIVIKSRKLKIRCLHTADRALYHTWLLQLMFTQYRLTRYRSTNATDERSLTFTNGRTRSDVHAWTYSFGRTQT
jgi:hypothetical protein